MDTEQGRCRLYGCDRVQHRREKGGASRHVDRRECGQGARARRKPEATTEPPKPAASKSKAKANSKTDFGVFGGLPYAEELHGSSRSRMRSQGNAGARRGRDAIKSKAGTEILALIQKANEAGFMEPARSMRAYFRVAPVHAGAAEKGTYSANYLLIAPHDRAIVRNLIMPAALANAEVYREHPERLAEIVEAYRPIALAAMEAAKGFKPPKAVIAPTFARCPPEKQMTVVMFGVQVWPLIDGELPEGYIGNAFVPYDDYEQICAASWWFNDLMGELAKRKKKDQSIAIGKLCRWQRDYITRNCPDDAKKAIAVYDLVRYFANLLESQPRAQSTICRPHRNGRGPLGLGRPFGQHPDHRGLDRPIEDGAAAIGMRRRKEHGTARGDDWTPSGMPSLPAPHSMPGIGRQIGQIRSSFETSHAGGQAPHRPRRARRLGSIAATSPHWRAEALRPGDHLRSVF